MQRKISKSGLIPIVEPEIPIDHPNKADLETQLYHMLDDHLKEFDGKCIFKLTLPETPNLYKSFTNHPKVEKVVGLSGGYSTLQACDRLGQQDNVSASFSRALSEGLYTLTKQTMSSPQKISDNIKTDIKRKLKDKYNETE